MFAYKSDIGRVREKNEDIASVLENESGDILMMVLDGMGGHKHGEVASNIAEQFIQKEFLKKKQFYGKIDMFFWLKRLIIKLNKYLFNYSKVGDVVEHMGTTLSCYLIHNKNTLMCYIGDTRCYLVKDGIIIQKSEDETYVQFLYSSGRISLEEKDNHPSKNIITNAVGCYPSVIINLSFIKENYDGLLLCSDGLYNMVNKSTIEECLQEHKYEVNKCVEELIIDANNNGGKDNIALALLMKGERYD